MEPIEKIVKAEAFHWGDAAAKGYFDPAEQQFHQQWASIVEPLLKQHPIDFSHTLDLACGRGRNSEALSRLARRMTLVDVNPENIAACKARFNQRPAFTFILNNGYDLGSVNARSVTFLYSFDAMVHFDFEIVMAYVREGFRILAPHGYGFIHHSNYTASPGASFENNPHWRNFMSRELFAHLCIKAGFVVEDQRLLDWGGVTNLDCLTVFRKPLEE
jgi:ubiquinone/menaquinone biosynthesis C-methylase UbiE